MNKKISIVLILLAMFLLTQFLGLWMINAYSNSEIPYGMQNPENASSGIFSLIISFIFAIALLLILMKYKWKLILRIWFFSVITLALGISLTGIFRQTTLPNASLFAIIVAALFASLKMFRPNVIIHNLTEFLIYPGIAVIFVPILTPFTSLILLVLLSLYDAWAVWKSGLMIKMAKFQMSELKIFGGFILTSLSKKTKEQIEKIKQKYKGKKIPKSVKTKKFKINISILGGGDIIFPIITAGVFMRAIGLIPALFIIGGAFMGLFYLLIFGKKAKGYPAMPFITAGIFISLAIWRIFIF